MSPKLLPRKSLLLVFALAAGAAVAAGRGQASREHAGRAPIEGTWRVQVQLVNCDTGDAMGPTFPSLLTFGRGGTLVETTGNASFFPAVRGPGHGVWSADDWEHYHASTTAFITREAALVQTQTITQDVDLDDSGDSFSATAVIQFFDPAGTLVRAGCATAAGTRY